MFTAIKEFTFYRIGISCITDNTFYWNHCITVYWNDSYHK